MDLQHLQHLSLVYVAYILAAASPGPSNMAIMGVAMRDGRASAVALALGVVTGSLFWAGLAAAGISTLLTTYAEAITALKIAGGLYLLYMAYMSGRSALSNPPAEMPRAVSRSRAAQYRRGLLIHLTNPKSILGWIAILSLGLGQGTSAQALASILAGCALLSVSIFVGYAVLFSTSFMSRAYRACRRWIEGLLAVVFGLAGIRLLLSRS